MQADSKGLMEASQQQEVRQSMSPTRNPLPPSLPPMGPTSLPPSLLGSIGHGGQFTPSSGPSWQVPPGMGGPSGGMGGPSGGMGVPQGGSRGTMPGYRAAPFAGGMPSQVNPFCVAL